MACIKVDYEQMERTALVIEEYVECLTRRMEQVKGEVIDLKMAWQGTDADQFKIYFEKKNDSNEDIEKLHAFFDKQNIKWRKSIL